MLSFTQVFLITLGFFCIVGAVGVYAALSAKKAGMRERQERERGTTHLPGSAR